MTDRQKAFISIILVSILSGANAPLTKIGLREIPVVSFVFLRFFLASLVILPFIIQQRRHVKDIIRLLPLSILATINIIFFTLGVHRTTATISQLLYAAVPLLTALIAYYFLKDKLNLGKIFGVLLGFLGVIIIIFLPILEHKQVFSGDLIGNLLITVAIISYSSYLVFSKKFLKVNSPFVITSVFIFLTTILMLPFSVLEFSTGNLWWNNLTKSGIFSLIYMAFVSTILTYLLSQYAIKHGGSVFASMTLYIIPVITFLLSFILLGERLTYGIIIGGCLSLGGVLITTKK